MKALMLALTLVAFNANAEGLKLKLDTNLSLHSIVQSQDVPYIHDGTSKREVSEPPLLEEEKKPNHSRLKKAVIVNRIMPLFGMF